MSLPVPDAARWTAVLVLATACSTGDRTVQIEHAAVTRDVLDADAAAYFTLRVDGTGPDSITEVAIDEAQIVSVQTVQAHRVSGGTTTTMMMPVGPVPIGPTRTVRFGPGGYTGVIYGLRHPFAPGDSVMLTVTLTSGRKATVKAPVLVYEDLEAALDPAIGPSRPDAAPTATEGSRLYRANGCASCHGTEGHGDGPVGRDLVPPPRDFRVAAAFKAGADPHQIARTLALGVPGGGSMPRFAHLRNHERQALALYLVSLRTSPDLRSTTR